MNEQEKKGTRPVRAHGRYPRKSGINIKCDIDSMVCLIIGASLGRYPNNFSLGSRHILMVKRPETYNAADNKKQYACHNK